MVGGFVKERVQFEENAADFKSRLAPERLFFFLCEWELGLPSVMGRECERWDEWKTEASRRAEIWRGKEQDIKQVGNLVAKERQHGNRREKGGWGGLKVIYWFFPSF